MMNGRKRRMRGIAILYTGVGRGFEAAIMQIFLGILVNIKFRSES